MSDFIKTLDMFKVNRIFNGKMYIDKCDECNVPENVEHIIMWCKRYNAERRILQKKIYKL